LTVPYAVSAAVETRTTPQSRSTHVFNLIMAEHFPGQAAGWCAGARFDPAQQGVLADIPAVVAAAAQGGALSGRVMFVLGVQLSSRAVDDVRRELLRVLRWRIGLGLLTAADVRIAMVKQELQAMKPLALRQLRGGQRVDPAAQGEIDRILAISTQIPLGAQFDAGGAASLEVGGVNVRILPDKSAGEENRTELRPVADTVQVGRTPGYEQRGGRITRMIGAMPQIPSLEIQTTYAVGGPKAVSDPVTATSAYGRGATRADEAAGDTSLRFHESRHGADFLDYLRAHPYRPFQGHIGMTVAHWRAEERAFGAAHNASARGLSRLAAKTDCVVGARTIDDENRGKPGYRLQCRPRRQAP
jgi:hypothetical protein